MGSSANFIMIERNSEALEITLCYYKINRNFGKCVGESEWRDKVRLILDKLGEVRFHSFGYGAWIEIFLR